MGFVGENGAGKDNDSEVHSGYCPERQRHGRIFGKEARSADREDIGVVFAEMAYQQDMTGKKYHSMYRKIYRNWQEETFFRYLDRLGIDRNKSYKTCPGACR